MKWLRIALGAALLALVALVALGGVIWATRPTAGPGQIVLRSNVPFSQGSYFAFVSPWGGEMLSLLRPWSPYADSIAIDLDQFPDKSEINWRWPPVAPRFGPGVWGYNSVMYGNYDGGVPEKPIAPIRMRDLKTLRQTYSWQMSNGFGDGNVLTEFYLRRNPTDVHAKVIEVGFFLRMPKHTRAYFDSAPPVGLFIDEQGRRWRVHMDGLFCMFAPEKSDDLHSGTLDMLRALKWLQQKGKISGNEWMSGVALGVEPVHGIGKMSIDRWSVTMN